VIAERFNRHASNVEVFPSSLIAQYIGRRFISERLIECSLTGKRSLASGFRATSGFKSFAASLSSHPSRFTPGRRTS
jgi:hypothetical protein